MQNRAAHVQRRAASIAGSVALLTAPAMTGASTSLSSRAWLGHGTLPVYAFNKPIGLTVSHNVAATRGKDGRKLVLNDYAEMAHNTLRPAYVPASSPLPTAVGRLDKQTTGLLLFTPDGPLHELLLRPGLLPKVYEATIRLRAPEVLTDVHLERLRRGSELGDGFAQAECVEVLDTFTIYPPPARSLQLGFGPSKRSRQQGSAADEAAAARTVAASAARAIPSDNAYRLRVTVRIGRNRVVRRLLAAAGLPVYALRRVGFGPLGCDDFGEDFASTPGCLVALSEAQEAYQRRVCDDAHSVERCTCEQERHV